LGGGCATLPPLVSFSTGTPSSIFVQTVCCKRIGLLILILSWWSPLNAMDLCLAFLHLGLLLKESLVLAHTSTVDSCRDGAEREGCTIHYLRTGQRTMPMSFGLCLLQSGLLQSGLLPLLALSIIFALLDRSKKYLEKQKQPSYV